MHKSNITIQCLLRLLNQYNTFVEHFPTNIVEIQTANKMVFQFID